MSRLSIVCTYSINTHAISFLLTNPKVDLRISMLKTRKHYVTFLYRVFFSSTYCLMIIGIDGAYESRYDNDEWEDNKGFHCAVVSFNATDIWKIETTKNIKWKMYFLLILLLMGKALCVKRKAKWTIQFGASQQKSCAFFCTQNL